MQSGQRGVEGGAGFHTGFLAGGGRNTDSTVIVDFPYNYYTDILDNNCYHNYCVVTCYKLYTI